MQFLETYISTAGEYNTKKTQKQRAGWGRGGPSDRRDPACHIIPSAIAIPFPVLLALRQRRPLQRKVEQRPPPGLRLLDLRQGTGRIQIVKVLRLRRILESCKYQTSKIQDPRSKAHAGEGRGDASSIKKRSTSALIERAKYLTRGAERTNFFESRMAYR